jgi:hypothetical protein
MKNTVTLLPESDDRTVCVRLDGQISEAGFEHVFLNAVRARFESGQPFNILLYFTDHKGWEEKAAALSFDFVLRYAAKAARVAYVSPPPGKVMHIKLFEKQFGGAVRIFDKADFDKALHWVKTGAE